MELLKASDIGALLQISSPGVYRMVKDGKLSGVVRGKKRVGYEPNEVIQMIWNSTTVAPEDKEFICSVVKQGRGAIRKAVASRKLVTATEAACLLQVTRNTIVSWTRDGILKPSRTSPRVNIYDVEDLKTAATSLGIGIEWAS